jgi:hypothetical protein
VQISLRFDNRISGVESSIVIALESCRRLELLTLSGMARIRRFRSV